MKRKIIISIIICITLALILAVIIQFAQPYVAGHSSIQGISSEDAIQSAQPHEQIDWEYWKSVNADVIGWVIVPGTSIDYPVVQARKDNPQYYLTHDVYGNYSIYGCPYVDAECDVGLDSLSPVIYGHNMIDGTMFTPFASMTDYAFTEEHSSVLILTPERTRVLEVVGARRLDANTEQKTLGFESVAPMVTYYTQEFFSCEMVRGEFDQNTEQVYTFVTCSYGLFRNQRTLVYAANA